MIVPTSERKSSNAVVLTSIFLAAAGFRLWLATIGYNYDVESFWIVGHIPYDDNLYEATFRYNYGPIWYLLLTVFTKGTSSLGISTFHFVIAAFLTLVDLGIAMLLRRRFGWPVAFLFLLNPVSALITGFHSQFDNFALLVGLVGLEIYGDGDERSLSRREILGLVVIGLSLMTKHVFVFLPVWLALRKRQWRARAAILLIPSLVFILGFLPFISAWEEIVDNVFLYQSDRSAPLLSLLLPSDGLTASFIPTAFFVAAMIGLGFVVRRQPVFMAGLVYTVALVAFSPAIANQYLVIPIAAAAVFPNAAFALYTFLGTLHLIFSGNGLTFDRPVSISSQVLFSAFAFLLVFALMQIVRRLSLDHGSGSRAMEDRFVRAGS